jgi:hypothetical protein
MYFHQNLARTINYILPPQETTVYSKNEAHATWKRGKTDQAALSDNGLPNSVLGGKRETSDTYATLDFLPKRKPKQM